MNAIITRQQLVNEMANDLQGSMRDFIITKYMSISDDEFIDMMRDNISLEPLKRNEYYIKVKSLSSTSKNEYDHKEYRRKESFSKIFE